MKGWFCIQIDQPRLALARTIDLTFRSLLVCGYRELLGQPHNCRVYRRSLPDGTQLYLFSPEAAEQLRVFVNWWDGIQVSEPCDVEQLEVVI